MDKELKNVFDNASKYVNDTGKLMEEAGNVIEKLTKERSDHIKEKTELVKNINDLYTHFNGLASVVIEHTKTLEQVGDILANSQKAIQSITEAIKALDSRLRKVEEPDNTEWPKEVLN